MLILAQEEVYMSLVGIIIGCRPLCLQAGVIW